MGRQPHRSFYAAVERWTKEELPKHKDEARERSHMAALAPFIEGKMLADAPEVAAEIKRKAGTLKAGTVNRRLALLRRLVNLAWKNWGWLDQPLGQRISLLPLRNERHTYLTEKQVASLAKRMPRSGGYALLAAYTGIRRGQLLRLTKANAVGDCLQLGTDGKTGQPQMIPLHPKVRHLAKKLPLCSDQILKIEWEAARKALGLPTVRFHDLRHTAASWLLQAPGSDLMHVRDLLGHTDVRMTQRYAHLRTEHLRRQVRRIGKRR